MKPVRDGDTADLTPAGAAGRQGALEQPTLLDPSSGLVFEPVAPRPSWPVAHWDRYEFLGFLGEGGMGAVYQARDRKLGRMVALKFLSGGQARDAARFLQEARTQSQVDHPNVCKVYESGEVSGLPFIAMQFVAGQTLEDAAASMLLEERVRVLAAAAEGLHAAHRIGLVHRDVKPANIMVGRGEDGKAHPYVMDFGLARELAAPGLTQTGMVVGTPHYMAPEQALAKTLDCRTDVHALGGVLYFLLTGRPPHDGLTPLEVLQAVVHSEPLPPRRQLSSLPPELEIIALKCLEKDPARRYDSARAIAEDLHRYLNDEPIAARPATMTYRLLKRVRKNRLAVGALVAGVLGVVVFAGLALSTYLRANEEARFAGIFGQEARYLEEALRRARTAPLHPLAAEIASAEARLATIAEAVQLAGRAGAGPGAYALGRGYLSLDRFADARAQLDVAWAEGYRPPEVSYALGRTYGELYAQELAAAERSETRETLAGKQAELARQWRDPALGFLQASGGVRVDAPEYVQALIASYENRPEEATRLAMAAHARLPWLYEAPLLVGDLAAERAIAAKRAGQYRAATTLYADAEAAYRTAAEEAPSDPRAWGSLCRLGGSRMDFLADRGEDPEPIYLEARAACENALVADSGRAEVHADLANAHKIWAEAQMARELDAGATLERAVDAAARALELDPASATAHLQLGRALLQQTRYDYRRGRVSAATLERAERALRTAAEKDPKLTLAHSNLGNLLQEAGRHREQQSLDPTPSYASAVASYRRALLLSPDAADLHYNLADAHRRAAAWAAGHDGDPRADLDIAVAEYEIAIRHNSNHVDALLNLGLTHLLRTRTEAAQDRDPGRSYLDGLRALEKAIALRPKEPGGHINTGTLHLERASWEAAHGKNPEPTFDLAVAAFEGALVADPEYYFARLRIAAAETARGSWRLHDERRGDPQPALGRAATECGLAEAANPASPLPPASCAEVAVAKARAALAAGRSPMLDLALARAAAGRALARREDLPQAVQALVASARTEAEWALRRGQCRRQALQAGIVMAERALARDPRAAGLLAEAGVLQRLAARCARSPELRLEADEKAAALLAEALRLGPERKQELSRYQSRQR